MIWLAVILLVAWILGWAVFHIAGALIHLLLVVAVAVFLYRLITGRRTRLDSGLARPHSSSGRPNMS